jgi:hypothetical protein
MDREQMRELLVAWVERDFPLPPELEAQVAGALQAAGGDADAASARLDALMCAEPEVQRILRYRATALAVVMDLIDLGGEYDPVQDTWRLPGDAAC